MSADEPSFIYDSWWSNLINDKAFSRGIILEFFSIADVSSSVETIRALTVEKLDQYCADIDKVLNINSENSANVYCIWGTFTVERQIINGGVRFTLPGCPNALAWTITTGFAPEPNKIVIHCTINRTEHDADFIESIESFINSWKLGLESNLPGSKQN
jgi:hypothetical protein